MDLDAARDFVRTHHRAVLATRTRDGGVQQSPVVVGVDAEGRLVVSSRETAYKVKNLRRDPRAQLCVMSEAFFGEWIVVEGTAEVLSLPEAMEPLVDYYRGVSGEHDDWDAYRAAMQEQRRVAIRVQPRRAGPDRSG
jgi:PPOX class probable F420-dependent enzyme